MARKMMGSVNPLIKISHSGDDWTIEFDAKVMSNCVKFTVGKPFEEKPPKGEGVIKVRFNFRTDKREKRSRLKNRSCMPIAELKPLD